MHPKSEITPPLLVFTSDAPPFMRDNASTLEFQHRISVDGDALSYEEHTMLDIYGDRFDHSDANTLYRR